MGPGTARFEQADLLVQAEVHALANRLLADLPRIDVLVNNAGRAFWDRQETVDGIERTLALNLVAPFLLTRLLLARMKASAPATVVNVATELKDDMAFDLEDPQGAKTFTGFNAYAGAKVALVGWTTALAEELEGTGVRAVSCHPGIVRQSGFMDDMPGWLRFIGPIVARLSGMAVSMDEAVSTPVWLATEGAATGGYYVRKATTPPPAQARDPHQVQRIVSLCESLLA
jgi:retinol dehydrogenase-14